VAAEGGVMATTHDEALLAVRALALRLDHRYRGVWPVLEDVLAGRQVPRRVVDVLRVPARRKKEGRKWQPW
jgi:hypothetical protein